MEVTTTMSFVQQQIGDLNKKLEELGTTAIVIGHQTIQQIPPCHRIVLNVVKAGADESFKASGGGGGDGDGDYQSDKPVYAMSGTLIDKIATAAGIKWDDQASHRTDGGNRPGFISYLAVGSYRDLSGAIQRIQGTYEIDFDAWRDESYQKKLETFNNSYRWDYNPKTKRRERTNEKIRPWNALPDETAEEFALRMAEKDQIQLRKNAARRAETGARNRAVCKALGIKRGGYLQSDLANKPIIVARLVADIDYANDPQAHAALVMMETGLADMAARSPGGFGAAMRQMLPAVHEDVVQRPALEAQYDAHAALPAAEVLDPEEEAARQEADHPKTTAPAAPEERDEQVAAPEEDEFHPEAITTVELFKALPIEPRRAVLVYLLRTRVKKADHVLEEGHVQGLDEANAMGWFKALAKCPVREA